jgi:hypothetical protein
LTARPEDYAIEAPERIDRRRAASIAYDVCRRALVPADAARRPAMRPVLDAWVQMIAAARAAGVPVIYTTPVSRADGADVVLLPTDLSAQTGAPLLTNGGGATNRGVEASVREAFNLDQRPGRPRLQPRQGDENVPAHPQARRGRGDAAAVIVRHRGSRR